MLFDFRLHVDTFWRPGGGLFRRLIVIRKRQPFSSIARRADDPGTREGYGGRFRGASVR